MYYKISCEQILLSSSAKPKLEALASALADISFNLDFTNLPGKVPKLEIKLLKTIPNETTPMEDNLNGR